MVGYVTLKKSKNNMFRRGKTEEFWIRMGLTIQHKLCELLVIEKMSWSNSSLAVSKNLSKAFTLWPLGWIQFDGAIWAQYISVNQANDRIWMRIGCQCNNFHEMNYPKHLIWIWKWEQVSSKVSSSSWNNPALLINNELPISTGKQKLKSRYFLLETEFFVF